MNITENNISYEYSLRHSYMHIKNVSLPKDSYESKLLKETSIPGTLKMNYSISAEDHTLSYVISGLESMEKHIESHPLTHSAISIFMESLNKLLSTLEEYMISENSVFLSPSSVFFCPENDEWIFTLIPSFENIFRTTLSDFLSYLLKHIDYTDDRAIIMAYSLFQESGKEFYQLTDLLRIVRTNMVKEQMSKINCSSSEFDSSTDKTAETRTMVSDDGIFRPIDAGIVLDHKYKNDSKNDFTSIKRNDKAINELPLSYSSSPSANDSASHRDIPELHHSPKTVYSADEIAFNSDYGNEDYPEDDLVPGVEIKDLSEEEHPKIFGLFSFPGKTKKCEKVSEAAMIHQPTIEESLSEKNRSNSLKGKILFTILLMILIPSLVWFLKGGLIFKKAFPLIMALEIGLCMMIALDLIMNKLPEDA